MDTTDPVAAGGTCDNCGRDGEDTAAVRRVYLLPPESGSTDPLDLEPQVQDDIEHWCPSCREQYPHAAA